MADVRRQCAKIPYNIGRHQVLARPRDDVAVLFWVRTRRKFVKDYWLIIFPWTRFPRAAAASRGTCPCRWSSGRTTGRRCLHLSELITPLNGTSPKKSWWLREVVEKAPVAEERHAPRLSPPSRWPSSRRARSAAQPCWAPAKLVVRHLWRSRRRRLAGGERCTRIFVCGTCKSLYERMRAPVDPARAPCRILERVHGFAEIGERGAVAFVEYLRITPQHLERDLVTSPITRRATGIVAAISDLASSKRGRS